MGRATADPTAIAFTDRLLLVAVPAPAAPPVVTLGLDGALLAPDPVR